eukprot:CAMPEP_0113304808 /NCGR_PEP_ID=MMETSP0010_2-20120614/4669_1 /TAXON_ID=216773 ORGANISM="Corethron hystrix, Strain 308" /NCGR_SAMPLE_ID=MMETSP0010_2 /ASSEMBLY_ACC=CAM_ASM_000155 /LENGTH=58 /DNA_ID=CAMNT_0000159065 /DNA_START=656 /DNA_END=829 /DNA_ORIENTATION=+ /assembly_acc=CAM_ASM_000155
MTSRSSGTTETRSSGTPFCLSAAAHSRILQSSVWPLRISSPIISRPTRGGKPPLDDDV